MWKVKTKEDLRNVSIFIRQVYHDADIVWSMFIFDTFQHFIDIVA